MPSTPIFLMIIPAILSKSVNPEREQRIIDYLSNKESISNSEACELLPLKDSSIKKLFSSTVKNKLIVSVDERKSRRYILPRK